MRISLCIFDVYSVDLCCKVEVQIFDKEGFNRLRDEDLVLSSKDYEIKDFKRGQDEFGYLKDDINRSDNFECMWEMNGKDNRSLDFNVYYVDDDNPIMTYKLIPSFRHI